MKYVALLLLAACINEVKAPVPQPTVVTSPAIAGQLVQLDGSASTDPASLPITYHWRIVSAPAGSASTMRSAEAPKASFVPDAEGEFVVALSVHNAVNKSAEATVSVTVSGACGNIEAPSAVQQLKPYAFPLTAGCQGSVERQWTITSRPDGSTATVSDDGTSFVPDVAGAYTLSYSIRIDNGPWLSARTLNLNVEACPITQTLYIDGVAAASGGLHFRSYGWFVQSALSGCGRAITSTDMSLVSVQGAQTILEYDGGGYDFEANGFSQITVRMRATDEEGGVAIRDVALTIAPFPNDGQYGTDAGIRYRSDGSPVMYWYDGQIQTLRVRALVVAQGGWVDEMVGLGLPGELDNTVSTGLLPSLDVASDGSLRVAFFSDEAGQNKLYYGERGATGWRTTLVVPAASASAATLGPQLVSTPSGTRVLFYLDNSSLLQSYRCANNCISGSWTYSSIGLSGLTTYQASVSPAGDIYVLYKIAANEAKLYKCGTASCAAPMFTTVTTNNPAVALNKPVLRFGADSVPWLGWVTGTQTGDYPPTFTADAFIHLLRCSGPVGTDMCTASGLTHEIIAQPSESMDFGFDAGGGPHVLARQESDYVYHLRKGANGTYARDANSLMYCQRSNRSYVTGVNGQGRALGICSSDAALGSVMRFSAN